MEGDKTSKAESKMRMRSGKYDKVATESDDDTTVSPPSLARLVPAEASPLASVHTEIKAMRTDEKSALHSFPSTLREDAKKELTELRDEINLALRDIRGDLKNTTTPVEEDDVAELEEHNLDLEDSL